MTFENSYDANTIDDLETHQKPDTQFVAEQMENVDTQQLLEQESVGKMNDVLSNMEQLLNDDFVEKNSGLLRNLSEKAKKGALIGAAAFGITAAASSPAFGEQIAQNGSMHIRNPHEQALKQSTQGIEIIRANPTNRIRILPLNRIRLEGQQQNRVIIDGQNIYNGNNRAFQGQLNQYEQRRVLPGATINGGPAYEIAPGVYGNENSYYKKGSNGSEVSIGTISIE